MDDRCSFCLTLCRHLPERVLHPKDAVMHPSPLLFVTLFHHRVVSCILLALPTALAFSFKERIMQNKRRLVQRRISDFLQTHEDNAKSPSNLHRAETANADPAGNMYYFSMCSYCKYGQKRSTTCTNGQQLCCLGKPSLGLSRITCCCTNLKTRALPACMGHSLPPSSPVSVVFMLWAPLQIWQQILLKPRAT